MFAYGNGASDSLDLYYSASVSPASWTYITTIVPSQGGAQVLSTTYVLPPGNLQAIRAQFRFSGLLSACSAGVYDDHDDLVFAAGSGAPAPQVVIRAWGQPDGGVYPIMQLQLGEVELARWVVTASHSDYVYTPTIPLNTANLRVAFNNDAYDPPEDRNLGVESLTFNGKTYQTTDANVYGVGAWSDNACRDGYLSVQALYCNGYFEFPTATANNLTLTITDDLTAPTGLQATEIGTQDVQLSWAAPSARKMSFAVYRDHSLIAMSDIPSYLDRTVSAGTGYDYSVAAYTPTSGMTSRSATLHVNTLSLGVTGISTNVAVNDLGGLRVYPNPWRADRPTAGITFGAVPGDATVKIFTLSGRWVKTLTVRNSSALWDLKTDSGDDAASGIYVYLVTDPRSDKVRGQLAIIR